MMMPEQRAKRILDFLAKRAGFSRGCEVRHERNARGGWTHYLALVLSDDDHLLSFIVIQERGGYVGMVSDELPASFATHRWSTLLDLALKLARGEEEGHPLRVRYHKDLGSPRQDLGWIYAMQNRFTGRLFLAETEASVEQLEILADVFASPKKITQDLQLFK